ncbi:MAG: phage holin family protein [Chitinophagales bacterium]
MREEFKKIEETVDHLKRYVNGKISQVKLGAAEKTSDILSVLIARTLVAIVFFFFVLLASEALAYGLGEYLGKNWLGFLIVAAFYLLAGVIIWKTKEKILRIPIMNGLIRRLFTKEINEDEED